MGDHSGLFVVTFYFSRTTIIFIICAFLGFKSHNGTVLILYKSRLSECNRSNAHREHTASMLLLAELHRPPSPRRIQHLPPPSLPALTQSRLFVLLTVKLSGESFTSGSVSSARPSTGNIWQRWSGGARAAASRFITAAVEAGLSTRSITAAPGFVTSLSLCFTKTLRPLLNA